MISLLQYVLNKLADARLITVAHETVEVAHEALISEWVRLREWWVRTERDCACTAI
jgi:hypothetical protein